MELLKYQAIEVYYWFELLRSNHIYERWFKSNYNWIEILIEKTDILRFSSSHFVFDLKKQNLDIPLLILVYLRCEFDRLIIFSKNVFWGATKPRLPPGIVILYANCPIYMKIWLMTILWDALCLTWNTQGFTFINWFALAWYQG